MHRRSNPAASDDPQQPRQPGRACACGRGGGACGSAAPRPAAASRTRARATGRSPRGTAPASAGTAPPGQRCGCRAGPPRAPRRARTPPGSTPARARQARRGKVGYGRVILRLAGRRRRVRDGAARARRPRRCPCPGAREAARAAGGLSGPGEYAAGVPAHAWRSGALQKARRRAASIPMLKADAPASRPAPPPFLTPVLRRPSTPLGAECAGQEAEEEEHAEARSSSAAGRACALMSEELRSSAWSPGPMLNSRCSRSRNCTCAPARRRSRSAAGACSTAARRAPARRRHPPRLQEAARGAVDARPAESPRWSAAVLHGFRVLTFFHLIPYTNPSVAPYRRTLPWGLRGAPSTSPGWRTSQSRRRSGAARPSAGPRARAPGTGTPARGA